MIEALWSRLKENGIFIIVEPGSPKGFRFVNSFRDWVLAKDRKEACIVTPCPGHNKCPMAENPERWCHFSSLTQRVPKHIFPKLTKDREIVNEKYSYLAVVKGETPNVKYERENEAK